MSYFDKLPIISYNGSVARNLLATTRATDNTKKQNMTYHPYTVRSDDRVDILAYRYYDDPSYAWLVWYSNETVDPYYGIGVTDDDLNNLIEKKYQSISRAQIMIEYYRNNWTGDDTELTIDAYSKLPGVTKKYYDPKLDQYGNVMSYIRKRKDMIRSTNKVINLAVTNSAASYIIGEVIQYISNGSIVASATVSAIDDVNDILIVQHVTGSFAQGNVVVGYDSGTISTVISSTLMQQLISDVEAKYWAPVTSYDVEVEKNSASKEIVLIDNILKASVENQLAKVLG